MRAPTLVVQPDGLEEQRDAHAHPHCAGNAEFVRVKPEPRFQVSGKHEQRPVCDVGSNHLHAVAVLLFRKPRVQVSERRFSLCAQQIFEPAFEEFAFIDAVLEADAQGFAHAGQLVEQAFVLEVVVVERLKNAF